MILINGQIVMKGIKNMTGHKHFILLSLLVFFSLSSCTITDAGEDRPVSHTYKKKLDVRVMAARRYYLIHIPPSYNPQKKYPLVIVLHGAFSTPKQMEKETGFSRLSDKENFIAAYPSGAYGLFGFLKHWNAGHCCGKAARENIDDVGFLLKVMDDIKNEYEVDSSRVYMTGFSNGGMLAYRFAAEHTEKLAAAACLGASLGGRAVKDMPLWITPEPESPLPMMVFHAEDDQSVPYNGGISPEKGGEREYVSAAESVDFWVSNNRCSTEPVVDNLYESRIIRKKYTDQAYGNDVVFYTIKSWGHRWPGEYFSGKLKDDDPLKDFDAAKVIWDFFKGKKNKH